MSSQPHDALSKQVYDFLLNERFGRVETEVEVPGEPLSIDVVFTPSANPTGDRHSLGLLGRAIARPCLLETYRNAPTQLATNVCLYKRIWYSLELRRRAKRSHRAFTPADEPQLWIVTPTASRRYRSAFAAMPKVGWPKGVYEFALGLEAGLIAIHHLPVEPETLWFRLLGRGRVQARAVREVLNLPSDAPLRDGALQLLSNWKIVENIHPELVETDREVRMALSQAYLEWEQKVKQESEQRGIAIGEERGEQRAKQEVALNMLQAGMSIEQVVALTGLDRIQVEQLRADRE